MNIFFYESGNNKCLKKCPPTKNFIVKKIENNYECLNKCPYNYPYYTKDTNGHNAYSKINPCDGDKPYFYDGQYDINHVQRFLCQWLEEIFIKNNFLIFTSCNYKKYFFFFIFLKNFH